MHESDKCVIYSNAGNVLVNGYVNFFEKNIIEIRLNKNVNLFENEILEIRLYNNLTGESVYTAKVLKYDNKTAIFHDVKHIRTVQKRSDVRVKLFLKYTISYRCEGTDLIEMLKPTEITILDLSAKGMLVNQVINTKDEMPLFEHYNYMIKFTETKEPIDLVFRIVRKKDYFSSYLYGCEFLSLNQKQTDEIYKYILKQQILQLKSRKK